MIAAIMDSVGATSFGILMSAISFHQYLTLANYSLPYLNISTRTTSLNCSLKHSLFGRAMQVPSDEKSLENSWSESIKEELLAQSKGQALLGSNVLVPYEVLQKSALSEMKMDMRKHVEMERRRKIGQANKGRIPWNKGKKHRPETRELIKKRTIEALRDPKVKKKMSESPRFHSDKSKAKIGFALERRWEERLKLKRVQDQCCLTWATTIAEAAKVSGHEKDVLEWDSYEKMKAEIVLEHFQWKAEKARRKDMLKLKVIRAAEAKAGRIARLAEERKEKKEKTRVRESKRAMKKLKNDEQLFLIRLKLKAKLLKLVASVPGGETGTRVKPDIEKWDFEFVRKAKSRREMSLAEQIQAAKGVSQIQMKPQ